MSSYGDDGDVRCAPLSRRRRRRRVVYSSPCLVINPGRSLVLCDRARDGEIDWQFN